MSFGFPSVITSAFLTTISPAVSTGIPNDSAFVSLMPSPRSLWDTVIDSELIEWGRKAESVDEDELQPPTLACIKAAGRLVQSFKSSSVPFTEKIGPNGDGGISLEWESGSHLARIEIDEVGGLRFTIFDGSKLFWSQEVLAIS